MRASAIRLVALRCRSRLSLRAVRRAGHRLSALASLLLCALALLAAALPAGPEMPALVWRRVPLPNADSPILALALDERRALLAVGDAQSVWTRELGDGASEAGATAWRRHGMAGAVSDLHFDHRGALWIASANGLWQLAPDDRLEDRSPAPGETARFIHRVTSVPGLIVVAGEAGAYVSRDGVAWTRIVHGLEAGPMRAVAIRELEGDGRQHEIWLLGPLHPWRVAADSAAEGLLQGPARRELIPGRPASQEPVDLVGDLPGTELVVVYSQALARALPAVGHEPRWEVIYPVLPPGALSQRIAVSHSGVWLATDQGLLFAATLAGPWQRTSSPAGSSPIVTLLAHEETILVASAQGLLEGRPSHAIAALPGAGRTATAAGSGSAPRRWAPPRDPDLREVHARALAYAGLEPAYHNALRRGVGRRGWLPILSLRGAAAYDRDTSDDLAQSFTYGELHDLRDRGNARSRDFEGSLTISWDLGDIAYNGDADDLSREARQVVTLRDNVLDEITQLYFDRRRTLIALSAFADRSDPEAVALELRSGELASGLDAWTGGWFSSQIRAAGEPGEAGPAATGPRPAERPRLAGRPRLTGRPRLVERLRLTERPRLVESAR